LFDFGQVQIQFAKFYNFMCVNYRMDALGQTKFFVKGMESFAPIPLG